MEKPLLFVITGLDPVMTKAKNMTQSSTYEISSADN